MLLLVLALTSLQNHLVELFFAASKLVFIFCERSDWVDSYYLISWMGPSISGPTLEECILPEVCTKSPSLLVVSFLEWSEVFKSVVAIPQATKVLIGVVWIIMVSVTNVVKVSKQRHGRHHVTARNAFPLLESEINPHGMII